MAIDWPSTLPQQPTNFTQDAEPMTIRSQPDSGPSKSRKRFTKPKRTAEMSFLMTLAQWEIMDAFYFTTLDGGATSMNFVHPWTGVSKEMYITKEPKYADDGPLAVRVSFPVEFF